MERDLGWQVARNAEVQHGQQQIPDVDWEALADHSEVVRNLSDLALQATIAAYAQQPMSAEDFLYYDELLVEQYWRKLERKNS